LLPGVRGVVVVVAVAGWLLVGCCWLRRIMYEGCVTCRIAVPGAFWRPSPPWSVVPAVYPSARPPEHARHSTRLRPL
jgi:hypothetical protein